MRDKAAGAVRPRLRLAAAMLLALGACSRAPAPAGSDATAPLAWAYPKGTTTIFGQPLGPGPFRVTGSALVMTRAQIENADGPIDWHPQDHPHPPRAVAGPPIGKATPCAECHMLNGAGYPAAADLAGLPAAYIIEQVLAFRSGARTSAAVGQPNTAEMIKTARAVTLPDLRAAAAYFAALPPSRWVRVVEGTVAPRTTADRFGWRNPAPGGGTEPIGDRIIELADDWSRLMIGDDHVMLNDYAPRGAIAQGARIVATGGSAGAPCASCHGAGLRGTDHIPPIAGRPAGYVARTLWDIRVGARRNLEAAPMLGIARTLAPADIRDVSAYLASLRR